MNNPKDGKPYATRPLSESHIHQKTLAKKRYYKELSRKAKIAALGTACMFASFNLGLATPQVSAHYQQEKQIVMTFDSCLSLFIDFYSAYPNYHYENENGTVNFDFAIQNPEEEGAQHCSYFFYGE